MSVIDLPVEILTKIVAYHTPVFNTKSSRHEGLEELCNLRLTSKFLRSIATPLLFKNITLELEAWSEQSRTSKTIAALLVAGSAAVFRETQSLLVTSCSNTTFFTQNRSWEGLTRGKLRSAISSLVNLRSARYKYQHGFEPIEVAQSVIDAFATLQHLQSVDLEIIGDRWNPLSLQPLSNLLSLAMSFTRGNIDDIASLLARSPHLSELRLEIFDLTSGPSFSFLFSELFTQVDNLNIILPLRMLGLQGIKVSRDEFIAHLKHFQKLEMLTIRGNTASDAATALGEICQVLQNSGVSLKGISTDRLHDQVLLNFLTSHTGFREIRLEPKLISDNKSSEMVDFVFNRILPAQQETLEVFTIGHCGRTGWRRLPVDNHLDEIAKCRKLRILTIRYGIFEETVRDYFEPSAVENWLSTCTQLPRLNKLSLRITPDTDESDEDGFTFETRVYRILAGEEERWLRESIGQFVASHGPPNFIVNGGW